MILVDILYMCINCIPNMVKCIMCNFITNTLQLLCLPAIQTSTKRLSLTQEGTIPRQRGTALSLLYCLQRTVAPRTMNQVPSQDLCRKKHYFFKWLLL